ncbi:MAG: hypothetical protein WCJ30_13080 [Deltaproteobacteria bacterium]
MKRDDAEIHGLKQQPTDSDESHAWDAFGEHRVLIARSLGAYRARGHAGLLYPCPYLRDKSGGRYESGLAYFGSPDQAATYETGGPFGSRFDGVFGPGFTTMMSSMFTAISESARATGIGLYTSIGLEARPRMQLETIEFSFMVVDQTVVCLKTKIAEEDPVWSALREGGVEKVVRIPALPVET